MRVPTSNPSENGAVSSTARGVSADSWPVSTECSRRAFVQAGSVMGLLALAGCAGPEVAEGPTPGIAWPTGPTVPPRTIPDPPRIAVNSQPTLTPVPEPRAVPTPAGLPTGVLPRSRWTNTALVRPGNVRPMNGVAYITIHHDGLPQTLTSDGERESISRLRSIQSAHTNRKSTSGEKWADIGYHYIIDRAGRVWEGRPIAYQGAHVQDRNENNIGVMCLGNFAKQSPSKAQTDRLDQFVAQLMRTHGIALRNVRTHQEWNPTECPGRSLQTYMSRTRSRGGGMALAVAETHPQLLA